MQNVNEPNNGLVFPYVVNGNPFSLAVFLLHAGSWDAVSVMKKKPKLLREQSKNQIIMFDERRPVVDQDGFVTFPTHVMPKLTVLAAER